MEGTVTRDAVSIYVGFDTDVRQYNKVHLYRDELENPKFTYTADVPTDSRFFIGIEVLQLDSSCRFRYTVMETTTTVTTITETTTETEETTVAVALAAVGLCVIINTCR